MSALINTVTMEGIYLYALARYNVQKQQRPPKRPLKTITTQYNFSINLLHF